MNENKKLLIEQYVKQYELYNDLLKAKSLQDLYVFNKHILKVEQGKQELASFHKDLCRYIRDDRKKKKLILIPRGHLKSTLITIGYTVQRTVENVNTRTLILNATWQMAVDFLTEIKRHLRENEKILELWGDTTVGASEWSADRITLKRTDTNIKGPTVWAAGVESNLVGSHPDLIIFDDVVARENTTTPEQKEKVILRYKDALDLLEPGGQLIIIGTRWAEDDLYGWIMNRENNIFKDFDILVLKAYTGNIETGEEFVPLWPEKFSQKELLGRLNQKGWYEFSSQYLNDPVPEEDATFKRSDFRYFSEVSEIKGKQMKRILTVDPAISMSKEADNTAIVGTGLDQFGNIFILDIVKGHFTPQQIIEYLFRLQETWHFDLIGVETIAYQKALSYSIQEEIRKRKRYLPIVEIQQHETSKDQRIKGLQPLYQQNKIYHRKDLQNTAYLEDELLHFPRSRRDDVIDALSMQLEYWVPPRKKNTRYHHQYLY